MPILDCRPGKLSLALLTFPRSLPCQGSRRVDGVAAGIPLATARHLVLQAALAGAAGRIVGDPCGAGPPRLSRQQVHHHRRAPVHHHRVADHDAGSHRHHPGHHRRLSVSAAVGGILNGDRGQAGWCHGVRPGRPRCAPRRCPRRPRCPRGARPTITSRRVEVAHYSGQPTPTAKRIAQGPGRAVPVQG